MNVGDLRRLIQGLKDEAPVVLAVASSTREDLNVTIETIAPSSTKSHLVIHVAIVQDGMAASHSDNYPL